MVADQAALNSALNEGMNDAMTAWVVSGHYEAQFLVDKFLAGVPEFSDSVCRDDGFAHSGGAACRWTVVDADWGSAIFVLPDSLSVSEDVRLAILDLQPEFTVSPSIYGDVDPKAIALLGDNRIILRADEYLKS